MEMCPPVAVARLIAFLMIVPDERGAPGQGAGRCELDKLASERLYERLIRS